MKSRPMFWSFLLLLAVASIPFSLTVLSGSSVAKAGVVPDKYGPAWRVHEPITHSNLAVFPITGNPGAPAGAYLTLDEGLTAGTVEVTELGAGLVRRRPGTPRPDQAQVNKLALINHSKQPLLLLAGEIVTGGKQDRVVTADRIVLPGAELPLDVFCVEPGRWHGSSHAFGTKNLMAAPSVRQKAAVAQDQSAVWAANEVARSGMVDRMAADARERAQSDAPGTVAETVVVEALAALSTTTSYAVLEADGPLKRAIDETSNSLQRDYEKALREALREQKVTGVVVAINGEVVWADVFANEKLFEQYWPKLLRSYVVEAMSVAPVEHAKASRETAEKFLFALEGKQIIEVEPGEFRLLHYDHPRYDAFQLVSLFEKNSPLLHFSKLRKEIAQGGKPRPRPIQRRR